MSELQIGTGRSDITPAPGTPQGIWGAQTHERGVAADLPLYATALGKIARLFTRLEARVFRPAVAMFTSNEAVLPFPLRTSLNRIDAQLDELIYQAFPQAKAS